MYQYEMHAHTRDCSACARSDAVEMVDAVKARGYAGIVLTNHFYRGNTGIDRSIPWKDFVEAYKQDYWKAKAYGDKVGIAVFFGLEEGIGDGKEGLIYGLEADVIANEPDFVRMPLNALSAFIHKHDGVIYAAHPYRNRSYTGQPQHPDMRYLDGVEVYNAGNTDEENHCAEAFAQRTGVSTISGGDVHITAQIGKAGIATFEPIQSNKDLVRVLKSGEYRLVVDGEIV